MTIHFGYVILFLYSKKEWSEDMFEIDTEMAAKLRERRARKNITLDQASLEIGISRRTLGKIENEQLLLVRKTVFKKLVDWLVNEKVNA